MLLRWQMCFPIKAADKVNNNKAALYPVYFKKILNKLFISKQD